MSDKYYIENLNPELDSNDQGDFLIYFDCPACQTRQNINLELCQIGEYVFCSCGNFSFYLDEESVKELNEPPHELKGIAGKIGRFR